MTSQRQLSDVAQLKETFLPKLGQVELGFSCLTSKASSLVRPKKSRVYPGCPKNSFDRIKNRTDNTHKML